MELHPFLEKDTAPNAGLWYVLSITGDCPSMRVGHSCSYVPNADGCNGKVFFIGGANPSATFAETYVLDLDQFAWDTLDTPGLRARYEHAAFQPKSLPNKLFIFGGADQGGNHNDIQMLDINSNKWKTITGTGNVPSPRTYHNNICIGDKFIVYSGGQSGSDPVGDRQVHCFNASTSTWSILNIKGDTPKPRHGHLVLGAGNKIYVHGGMSGTHFYDDLHVLDIEKEQWRAVKQKKNYPSARAAHGGVIVDDSIYVFGGMNRDGALDDLWQLSIGRCMV
jgi:N-acetylneuraminic acid mutarotase